MTNSMMKNISYVDGISFIDTAEVNLPVVVFLHGLGETKESYEKMLEQFAGQYRCIALDFRGHGDSLVEGPYTLEQASKDLLNVLEDLKIEFVSIVAGSYFCWVAQYFALHYPEKVDRVILLDGGYYEVDSVEGDLSQPTFKTERELDSHLAEHIKEMKMAGVEVTRDVIPLIKNAHKICFEQTEDGVFVHKTPDDALRGYLQDIASMNFRKEVASKVKVPILLILADQLILPKEFRDSNEIDLFEYKRVMSDLQITQINKSDHLLMLSHPVEASLISIAFLQ